MVQQAETQERPETDAYAGQEQHLVVKLSNSTLALDVFNALRARGLTSLTEEVCGQRGVMIHEVCGRVRTRSVSRARHDLWWRIYRDPERQMSLGEIACLFRRDPSTVLAGVRAHDQRVRSRVTYHG